MSLSANRIGNHAIVANNLNAPIPGDIYGDTPLHALIRLGIDNPEVKQQIKRLVLFGAKLDTKNKAQQTPYDLLHLLWQFPSDLYQVDALRSALDLLDNAVREHATIFASHSKAIIETCASYNAAMTTLTSKLSAPADAKTLASPKLITELRSTVKEAEEKFTVKEQTIATARQSVLPFKLNPIIDEQKATDPKPIQEAKSALIHTLIETNKAADTILNTTLTPDAKGAAKSYQDLITQCDVLTELLLAFEENPKEPRNSYPFRLQSYANQLRQKIASTYVLVDMKAESLSPAPVPKQSSDTTAQTLIVLRETSVEAIAIKIKHFHDMLDAFLATKKQLNDAIQYASGASIHTLYQLIMLFQQSVAALTVAAEQADNHLPEEDAQRAKDIITATKATIKNAAEKYNALLTAMQRPIRLPTPSAAITEDHPIMTSARNGNKADVKLHLSEHNKNRANWADELQQKLDSKEYQPNADLTALYKKHRMRNLQFRDAENANVFIRAVVHNGNDEKRTKIVGHLLTDAKAHNALLKTKIAALNPATLKEPQAVRQGLENSLIHIFSADIFGRNVFHYACGFGSGGTVALLLQHLKEQNEADLQNEDVLNRLDNDGYSPLMLAAALGQVDNVELLLTTPSIHYKSVHPITGFSALDYCIHHREQIDHKLIGNNDPQLITLRAQYIKVESALRLKGCKSIIEEQGHNYFLRSDKSKPIALTANAPVAMADQKYASAPMTLLPPPKPTIATAVATAVTKSAPTLANA